MNAHSQFKPDGTEVKDRLPGSLDGMKRMSRDEDAAAQSAVERMTERVMVARPRRTS